MSTAPVKTMFRTPPEWYDSNPDRARFVGASHRLTPTKCDVNGRPNELAGLA